MPQAFNIDAREVVELTNKLEKLHKSALPVTVRTTLDDAAKDAKFNQVERAFKEQFIIRRPTFIKSQTVYNRSMNTFNINQMESSMGVAESRKASKGLEKQETGGQISGRDYIPTNLARVSKNYKRRVSRSYYRSKMKVRNTQPITQIKDLIPAAYSEGVGSVFLYKGVLIQIKSLKEGAMKFVNLYAVEPGRSVGVKSRPYISVAGERSSQKIPRIYKRNALRKIKQAMT